MPEATQIMFKFTELAELLVKKQDLHEGHWGIVVRFGISAANVALGSSGPLPTAIVPILELGIQREKEPTPLTVDASVVNPISEESSKRVLTRRESDPKKTLVKKQ